MPNDYTEFKPAPLLSHHHAQTLLASIGPRQWFVRHRARALLAQSQHHIIPCDDDIKLTGFFTPALSEQVQQLPNGPRSLVILLHGWEGCADSSYLLSAGARLHNVGHSVFRLNFRDHGDSHLLNRGLFNSVRINEVLDALVWVINRFPHEKVYLAGFSLGGNFALRVASQAKQRGLPINRIAGICPLINPYRTTADIEDGLWIYHYYFLKRWKASLLKKNNAFSEYDFSDVLNRSHSLSQLNEYFVPQHTDFDDPTSYLNAYQVTEQTLENISTPTDLLIAGDDPIVQTRWFRALEEVNNVNPTITAGGGHCAYIKDWQFYSYADDWLLNRFPVT